MLSCFRMAVNQKGFSLYMDAPIVTQKPTIQGAEQTWTGLNLMSI